MARIIKNCITNLIGILLAFALCALLPTNTQATSSLSEKYRECESKFWYKSTLDFKKSQKSKYEPYDKEEMLMKWQKYSNCRCKSALNELKGKESYYVCYQIAQFNKASGEFIGELSVYKTGDEKVDVGLKFSDPKIVDGQWTKDDEGYFHSKTSPKSVGKDGKFSIEKYYISGKIPKNKSLNKITSDEISPSKLNVGNDQQKRVFLKKDQEAIIPFSKFVDNGLNFQTGENPDDATDNGKNPKDPDGAVDSGKNPKNPDGATDNGKNPKNPEDEANNGKNPKNPDDATDNGKNPKNPDGTVDGKNPTNGNDGKEPVDASPISTPKSPVQISTPNNIDAEKGTNDTTNAETNTIPTSSAPESPKAKQEEANELSGMKMTTSIGLIIFGSVAGAGIIVVLYSTYGRRKWREHYRRRQAAFADSSNYSGGRAL
ncbi:15611_t:CDS:2 [Funneliformis mosseae]|uniref:15611_t:CDS:1 n=1 Tax=Funneliformis mosseae TaxID=27381 RepID=A0A9N9GJ28_FUNMO|nr:15611_t:CDS:2 [Funneliformis mosseae]